MRIKLLCKCNIGNSGDVVDVDKKGAKAMVEAGDAKYDMEITKEDAIRLNKELNKTRKRKQPEEQQEEKPSPEIKASSGKILFKEPVRNSDTPKWLIIKEVVDPPCKQDMEIILKGEQADWLHHNVFEISEPNQWRCSKCCGTFISKEKPFMCQCCNRETHMEPVTEEIDASLWKLPLWKDIPVEDLDMGNLFLDMKNLLKRKQEMASIHLLLSLSGPHIQL